MAIITLRRVDDVTAKTLKERARKEGLSVNSFLLQLVKDSLKIGKKKRSVVYHDLDPLAGPGTGMILLNLRETPLFLKE